MSLLANDSFMKHVNKDPEGYGKDHAWKRNSFSSMLLTYYGFKPKKKNLILALLSLSQFQYLLLLPQKR